MGRNAKVRDRVAKECIVSWIVITTLLENDFLVTHVNTDEKKRVQRQRAILYMQSILDFKYFKCCAWLRAPATSNFAQDMGVSDWEVVSVKKRAGEQAM